MSMAADLRLPSMKNARFIPRKILNQIDISGRSQYPQPIMKPNRTQVIGAIFLAALVLLGLLIRYWKFSG